MTTTKVETGMWAHAAHPSMALNTIDVLLERLSPTNLRIRYEALGRISDLAIPAPAASMRADKLWRTTCFELFLRSVEATAYREFNFSPSGQWAAYEFRAYREGMNDASLPGDPVIETEAYPDRFVVDVRLSLDLSSDPYLIGLSAVAEEQTVGTSYWAVSHPSERPDFHHPACFVIQLPSAPGT